MWKTHFKYLESWDDCSANDIANQEKSGLESPERDTQWLVLQHEARVEEEVLSSPFWLTNQSHMRESTQASGFFGHNTRLSGHHLPYMVKQRSTSQKYNHTLALSIKCTCIAHCVKRSEICTNFIQRKQASNYDWMVIG